MKITEERFTELLVDRIGELPMGYLIEKKLTVLYDLSISQDGNIHMGVDLDSGYPIRGKGKGFEQDIVIYRKLENAHTVIIPYIIAEVKYQSVTTHDAIVYSKKAEKIRSIYPYVRYGLILGNFRSIPGRVIRHGESFDFITAIQYPFSEESVEELRKLLLNELHTSENMESIRSSKKKIITIQKNANIEKFKKMDITMRSSGRQSAACDLFVICDFGFGVERTAEMSKNYDFGCFELHGDF